MGGCYQYESIYSRYERHSRESILIHSIQVPKIIFSVFSNESLFLSSFRNQLFSAIKAVSVDEEEEERMEERDIEMEEEERPLSSIQSCPSIDISLVDDSISSLSPSLSVRIFFYLSTHTIIHSVI